MALKALDLPKPPWVVAHRGASAEIENTVAACQRAAALGAHMVEIDVQLTADGEIVVFHDWDLQRLAGREGVIEELGASRVVGSALRATRCGRRLVGTIPSLTELLDGLPPELPVNIELKRRRAPSERLVTRLGQVVAGRAQLLLSSFDWELLALVRRALPALPVAPIASRGAGLLAQAGEELGAFSLHCHSRIARRLLEETPERPVLVYTVNRLVAARRWVALGAAGIFTDETGTMLRGLLAESPVAVTLDDSPAKGV